MAKKPIVCKLAVLGDMGVGKSALISRIRSKEFVEEFDPTIEDSYTIGVVVNDQQCTLEILDTAGADEYLYLRDGWIRANEGFILVYSISSTLSFTRIQGLYDQIQQIKKSPHPHTSPPVPIMLVGNKVDTAKRRVSLLEGEGMARKLGCRFVEASARNGENVEESFYTIVKQLQKQSATTGIEVLDDLIDSLPEWDNLLNHLEGEISRSAIANTRSLVPALRPNENVGLRLLQKLATLHVPRFAKRQRSFPGINSFQLVSQNQRASSVGRGMSQPSENPDYSVLEGNYDLQVQGAFKDILTFLSRFEKKIRDFEREEKFTERMARMKAVIDVGDNCIDGEVGLEIRDNEETPAAEKVKKMGIVQQLKLALGKCQNLCKDAGHEVIRRGECGDKIQEMKKEFAGMIEIAAKLRSRGEIA
ncbi:ras family-domain-containing protein [Halenospora varia]|nr:ras family-domain-containing protein [Halenospora varia]